MDDMLLLMMIAMIVRNADGKITTVAKARSMNDNTKYHIDIE